MAGSRTSENLPPMPPAVKLTMDAGFATDNVSNEAGEVRKMSYAEAKEIALLRLELRACWDRADRVGGRASALRLANVAGNDNELKAEARRWVVRFG